MMRRDSQSGVWDVARLRAGVRWGASAAAALALSGCASPVPVREHRVFDGASGQGAAWEAVFLPTRTDRALADAAPEEFGEYARRDEALTVRPAMPLLASLSWPEPERPTLERPRRIVLPTRAEVTLFFLPWDWPWHRPRPHRWE